MTRSSRLSVPALWTARCSPMTPLVLRLFGEDGNDRLLLVNLGVDCSLSPAPEPLLASLPV